MKVSPTPILLFLLLLYFAGMLRVWGWAIGQIIRRKPLELPRFTAKATQVPWGVGTIILVLAVYLGVNVGVVRGYSWLTAAPKDPASRSEAVHQAAVKKETSQKPSSATTRQESAKTTDRGLDPGTNDPTARYLSVTERMFMLTLINEILIVVIPFLVILTSGAKLDDLGLSLTDWRRQVKIGVATALLVAPVVFLIQYLAIQIWASNKHPVEDMIRKEFTPGIAYLAVVSAVVMAPLLEELMFRGLIQSWLIRLASWRPRNSEDPMLEIASIPPEVSVDVVPALDSDNLERPARQAILLTSFVFASVHFEQWPAPIPIFLLSVALGVVFHRTGSLLTSIATHATFNSLSTLLLFVAMTADPKSLPTGDQVPQPAKLGASVRPTAREHLTHPTTEKGLASNP